MSALDLLPREIWQLIVSEIDDPKTFRSACLVCRLFREIVSTPQLQAQKKEEFSRVFFWLHLREMVDWGIVPATPKPEPEYTRIFYLRMLPDGTLHGKQSYKCNGWEGYHHYDTGRDHGLSQSWYNDQIEFATNYEDGLIDGFYIHHNTCDRSKPEYIIEECRQGLNCSTNHYEPRKRDGIAKIPDTEEITLNQMFDLI